MSNKPKVMRNQLFVKGYPRGWNADEANFY